MNININDNGAAYMVTVNGLIVAHFNTLGDAWRHIAWMHKVASQKFSVGKKQVPVEEWIAHMEAVGYLDSDAGMAVQGHWGIHPGSQAQHGHPVFR